MALNSFGVLAQKVLFKRLFLHLFFVKKKRLNPVPKSLRAKKRYVLFECKTFLEKKRLIELFRQQLLELYGSIGFGQTNFFLAEYSEQTGMGIICVRREWEKKVLPFFAFLEKKGVLVFPKKVSGSLKALKKKGKLNLF